MNIYKARVRNRSITINLVPQGLHESLKREANVQCMSMGKLACKLIREGLERIKQKRVEFFNRQPAKSRQFLYDIYADTNKKKKGG